MQAGIPVSFVQLNEKIPVAGIPGVNIPARGHRFRIHILKVGILDIYLFLGICPAQRKQRHEKMMKMSEEQRQAMREKRSEKAGMRQ